MPNTAIQRFAMHKATTRPALTASVATKYAQLLALMQELQNVVVAFSGGIDSSLVAYVAHRVLGKCTLAVTSTSASLPKNDRHLTQALALEWGMRHRLIVTDELKNPRYLANPSNRCYFCKTTLYRDLSELAQGQPFTTVLNGVNADDFADFRPGLQAAKEHRVRAPLAECGFGKDDIRMLAFHLGLRNAFKPQSACLSSRVPYGVAISRPLLGQIESAEAGVRAVIGPLGFLQLRVRHHGHLGRIELENTALLPALQHHALLAKAVLEAGYRVAGLDVNGFRSGALNIAWRGALKQQKREKMNVTSTPTQPQLADEKRVFKANQALKKLGFEDARAHAYGWVVGLSMPPSHPHGHVAQFTALCQRNAKLSCAMHAAGFSAVALQIGTR